MRWFENTEEASTRCPSLGTVNCKQHNLFACQKLDPDCLYDTGDKLPDTNSELATIFENSRSDL